jgi:2-(1,2-epoxy-1,2-dihydrophenyl)acetyl-CoA isomerase
MTPAGQGVLARDQGAVRVLTLNRPERRNALDLDDRRLLLAELHDAARDAACRVVVLTGAGGFFSAGGDIGSMTQDPDVARTRLEVLGSIARAIASSSKPLIVAVEGGAFGAGLALAAAGDRVIAARDARFAASFGRLGLTGDTGVLWSLSQRVGPARAKELLLLCTELSADEAHRIGLVSRTVAPGQALECAIAEAWDLCDLSATAIAATKRIFSQPEQDLDSVLDAEAAAQMELLQGEDFVRRRAQFLSRRTKETPR